MSSNSSKLRWSVAFLAALLCHSGSGCLVFERQTMVYTFAPDGSEVRGLYVYEDLHVGGGNDDKSFKQAKEELESIMVANQRCYLAMPLLGISLAPPKAGETRSAADTKALALLQKHLSLAAGSFYLDKGGKLCAWQTVTIRDSQKFVEGLNELISTGMKEMAAAELAKTTRQIDGEMFRVLQNSAGANHAWLKLEPGRLSFALPGTPKGFADLKRVALHDLLVKELEQLASPPPAAASKPLTRDDIRIRAKNLGSLVKFLSETPISIDQRADSMIFAVGEGQGRPLRLNFAADLTEPEPVEPRKYESELVAHARSLKVRFSPNQTTEALIADFLKKTERAR
jgi:hypothetical protein